MKISEVIKKLQKVLEEHGDLEVSAYNAIYFSINEDTLPMHNNELFNKNENIRSCRCGL